MVAISVWEKESFFAPQDIIIIGAGFMGLWSALELKKKNEKLRITILERNLTPLGASTRNAGFACFGSPTELIHDASVMGTDSMLSITEMRYKGIKKIRQYFTGKAIDLDTCGGYECINTNYTHWNELDEKIEWLNKSLSLITGNESTFERKDKKIKRLGLQNFDALIENKKEAALHSGKLVQALMQKVQSLGVQILTGIEVSGWEKTNDTILITTLQHINFSTRQLLLCTNAFTAQLLPSLQITPGRGQIILTSPIPHLSMKGTFHFDKGFYYWRNLGNRILIGGARNKALAEETTTEINESQAIQVALEQFLREHVSNTCQYKIEQRWSGIMGFTENHQPFIEKTGEGIFVAIACNGMGVALSPVAAEKVSALMTINF